MLAGMPMNVYLVSGLAGLALLLVVGVLLPLFSRRLTKRNDSLRALLEQADRLEDDIRSCRRQLQQAHAVMSLNPDQPAAGEQEARQAIDSGLRALLQQRLWIRDRSAHASRRELDDAARAMSRSRERIQPLLVALDRAQLELDAAMREHITRSP